MENSIPISKYEMELILEALDRKSERDHPEAQDASDLRTALFVRQAIADRRERVSRNARMAGVR